MPPVKSVVIVLPRAGSAGQAKRILECLNNPPRSHYSHFLVGSHTVLVCAFPSETSKSSAAMAEIWKCMLVSVRREWRGSDERRDQRRDERRDERENERREKRESKRRKERKEREKERREESNETSSSVNPEIYSTVVSRNKTCERGGS